MKIKLQFKKENLWVGVFWSSLYHWVTERRVFEVWICFIPCCSVHISWPIREERNLHKVNSLWDLYEDLNDTKASVICVDEAEELFKEAQQELDIGDSKFMDRLRRLK